MFTKSPLWGWLLLLLVGIHSINGSNQYGAEHPKADSSFALPFSDYLHNFLQFVQRLFAYGKGSEKIAPATLEKPAVLHQDLGENGLSEMDKDLEILFRRRRDAKEKGVTEQSGDLSSSDISEASYVRENSEELTTHSDDEDATYEPIVSVTQASSEESGQVDQTDWKEIVHSVIKTRYKNYMYTNVSVVALQKALEDSDSKMNMSIVVPPKRTEKFKTLRTTIRKRWAIRDSPHFRVKLFENKLKEDSHVKDLLKGWSPEDLEILWIWSYQNVIFDFGKFENFYWKVVKIRKAEWENDIYDLIKKRYPKLNYPNVTVLHKNASSYYEDDERYSMPEDDDPNSKRNTRIDKFSKLRTALRTRWNLREQSSFNSDYFWQKLGNDKEIQKLVKDWTKDDLELLWMWSFQRATNDFPQFETFYKRTILGRKEGWRKSLYDMLKKWYKDGKKSNWIAVDASKSLLEGGDKGGPEEYLVEPDMMRAVRFIRTRSILRRKWGIGDKDDDKLGKDFYDEKFKKEKDGLLKSWTEHDLEMLRAWIHQNDTEDFLKFERFFNRVVQNIKEGWQKEVLALLKSWFDKQTRTDSTVHLANSTTEGRHPQDEDIPEERIEKFQELRRSLRKRWNITNGTTEYTSDDFHYKLRKDNQAKELVKDLPDEDLEMLWIWLIQTANDDFPQFENFYRRTVKITKNDWQQNLYELLKSKMDKLQKKNISVLNIDSDAFKTVFKNMQPSSGGIRKEEIDAYYKLRRAFRTRWNTTEEDFKKNFIEKLGRDNYTRALLKGLTEKEVEKLWIWVSQNETDDYPTFEAFISSILVNQKPRSKARLHQFLKQMYPNNTISTRILEPSSFSSTSDNYEEYDGAITSEQRRQDFSSLRRMLRKKGKVKDQPLSNNFTEFRQILMKSKEVKKIVENWSDEDLELLWLFTSQVATEDFRKFEKFFWQIARSTKPGWRKNIFDRLKKKYGNDPNVQMSEYDESKWAEEDANYCLNCGNKKPKEAVRQQERLSLLRQLIRSRWKLGNGSQMDYEEFKSKLLEDEYIQSYMVKALEENLRAFWLFVTQNDITDYDLLLKFLKEIINVENRNWRMRIYDIAKERYKNYPNSEVEVVKPDRSDSGEVSSETTELPEGRERTQNERDYRQLRLIARLRWKISKMKTLNPEDFEKKLEEDKIVQELIKKLNPSDMDHVWMWLYQDETEDYFKFKRLYYRIIKEKSETWTTESTTTTDVETLSTIDSSTMAAPTSSKVVSTESVPIKSTTPSATNISTTEGITEPNGSTEGPKLLSSTLNVHMSTAGSSSEGTSTATPSGRGIERSETTTRDLKLETSTPTNSNPSITAVGTVENSTAITTTSDQAETPTSSRVHSITESSIASSATPTLNTSTGKGSIESTTTSVANSITTEAIQEITPHGTTENPNLSSSTITVETSTAGTGSGALSTTTTDSRNTIEPQITTPDLKSSTSIPGNVNSSEIPSTAGDTVKSSTPIVTSSDQDQTDKTGQSTTDSSSTKNVPLELTTTSAPNIITTEGNEETVPHGSTENYNLLSSTITVDTGTSTAKINPGAVSAATPSGRAIDEPKLTTPDLKAETSAPSDPKITEVSNTATGTVESSTPIPATSNLTENPADSTTHSSIAPSAAILVTTTETIQEATPQSSTESSNVFIGTSTAQISPEAISTANPSGRGIEEPKITTPDLKHETSTPSNLNPSQVSSTVVGILDSSTPVTATSRQSEIPGSSQSTADNSTVSAPTPSVNAKTESVPIDLTTDNIPIESTATSAPNIITTKENKETVPQGSTENPNSLSSTITIRTSTAGSRLGAVSTATPSGRAIEEPKISTPDRSRSTVDSTTTEAIRDGPTEDSNLFPSTMTVDSSTGGTNSETIGTDAPHGWSTEDSKITTLDLNSGTIFPILNPSKVSSTAAGAVDGSTPSGNSAHSSTDSSIVSSAIPILKATTENIPIEATTTTPGPNVITSEGSQETAPQKRTENSNSLSSTITIGTSTAGSSLEAVSTATPSGRAIEKSKITTTDLKSETSTPSVPKLSEVSSTTAGPVDSSTSIAGAHDQTKMPGSPRVKSTSDSSTVPSATQPVSRSTENVPIKSTTTSAANDITTETMKEATPQGSSDNSNAFSSTIAVDTSTAKPNAAAISTATPSGRGIEQPKVTTPNLNPDTSTPKNSNPTTKVSSTAGRADISTPTEIPGSSRAQSTSDSSTVPAPTPSVNARTESVPIELTTASTATNITTKTFTEATSQGSTEGSNVLPSTITIDPASEPGSGAISTTTTSGKTTDHLQTTTPDLSSETSTPKSLNPSEVSSTAAGVVDSSTPIATKSDRTETPAGNSAHSTTDSSILSSATPILNATTENIPTQSTTTSGPNVITTEGNKETPQEITENSNLLSSTITVDTGTSTAIGDPRAVSTATPSGRAIKEPKITTPDLKPETSTSTPSNPNASEVSSTAESTEDRSTPVVTTSDKTEKPLGNQTSTDGSALTVTTASVNGSTERIPFESTSTPAVNNITTETIIEGTTEDSKSLSSTMIVGSSTAGSSSGAVSTATPSGRAIGEPKISTPNLKPETSTSTPSNPNTSEVPGTAVSTADRSTTSDKTEKPSGNQTSTDGSALPATPVKRSTENIAIESTTTSAPNIITTEGNKGTVPQGSTDNSNSLSSTITIGTITNTTESSLGAVSTATPSGRAIDEPKITTPDLNPETFTPSNPKLSEASSTAVGTLESSTPTAATSDQTNTPTDKLAHSTTDKEDSSQGTRSNVLSSTITVDTSTAKIYSEVISTATPSGRAIEEPKITAPDMTLGTSTPSNPNPSEVSSTTVSIVDNSTPAATTSDQTEKPTGNPVKSTPDSSTTVDVHLESTTATAINVITTETNEETTSYGTVDSNLFSSTMTVDSSTEGTSSETIGTDAPHGWSTEESKMTTTDLNSGTIFPILSPSKVSSTAAGAVDSSTPIAPTSDQTEKSAGNSAHSSTDSSILFSATPILNATTDNISTQSATTSAPNIIPTEGNKETVLQGSTESSNLLSSTIIVDTATSTAIGDPKAVSTATPSGRAMEEPKISTPDLKQVDSSTPIVATSDQTEKPKEHPTQSSTDGSTVRSGTPSVSRSTIEAIKETTPEGTPKDSNLLPTTRIFDTSTAGTISGEISISTRSGWSTKEPKIATPDLNPSEVSRTSGGTLDSSTPIVTTGDQTRKSTGNPAQSSTDGTPLPGTTTSVNVSTQKTTSDQISITTETIQEATPQGSTESSNVFVRTSTARISPEAISTAIPSGRAIDEPKIPTPDLKPETSTPSILNPSHVSSTAVGILDSSTPVAATSRQNEIPGSPRAQSTSDSSTVPSAMPSRSGSTQDVSIESTTSSSVDSITTEAIKDGTTEDSSLLSSTMTVDSSTAGTSSETIATDTPHDWSTEESKISTPELNAETPKSLNPSEVSSTERGIVDNSTRAATTNVGNPAQSTTVSSGLRTGTPSLNATMENIPIDSTTTSVPNIITTEGNKVAVPQGSTENSNLLSSTMTVDTGTSTAKSNSGELSTATPSGRAIEEPKLSTPDLKAETSAPSNSKPSEISSTAVGTGPDTSTPIVTSDETEKPTGYPTQSSTDDLSLTKTTPSSKTSAENTPIQSTTTPDVNNITTEASKETTSQGTTKDSNLLSSTMIFDGETTSREISISTPSAWSTKEPKTATTDLNPDISTQTNLNPSEVSSTSGGAVDNITPIVTTGDQTEKPTGSPAQSTLDSSSTKNVPLESTTTSAPNIITTEGNKETVPHGSTENYNLLSSTITFHIGTSTAKINPGAVSAATPSGRAIDEPKLTTPDLKAETSAPSDPKRSEVSNTATRTMESSTPIPATSNLTENPADSTTHSSIAPSATPSPIVSTENVLVGSTASSAILVTTTETIQNATPQSSTEGSIVFVGTSTARISPEAISTAIPSGRGIEEPKITTPDLKPETSTPSNMNPSQVSSTVVGILDSSTPVTATSRQSEILESFQSIADSSTVPAATPSVNAKTESVPIDLTTDNIPTRSTTTFGPNIITTKGNKETVPQGSTENPNSLSSTITIGTSTAGSSLEAVSTATPSGRAIEEPKISTPDRSRSAVDSITTETIRDGSTNDSILFSSTMTVDSSTGGTNSDTIGTDAPHGWSTEDSKTTTPDLNSGTFFPILNPFKVSSTAAGEVDGSTPIATKSDQTATPSGNSALSTTDGSIASSAIPILKETTENIPIASTTISAPNIITTKENQETVPQGTTENSNSLSSTIGTSTAGSSSGAVSTVTPSGRTMEEPNITTLDLNPETFTSSNLKLSEASSTAVGTLESSTPTAATNDQTKTLTGKLAHSTTDREDTPQGTGSNLLSSTITIGTTTARINSEVISTATPSGRAIEEPKITAPDMTLGTSTPSNPNPSEVSSTTVSIVDNSTPAATTSDQTEKPTGNTVKSTPDSSTTVDVHLESTTATAINVITTETNEETTSYGTVDSNLFSSTMTVDSSTEGTSSETIGTDAPHGWSTEESKMTTTDLNSGTIFPILSPSKVSSTAAGAVGSSTPIAPTSDQTEKSAGNSAHSSTDSSILFSATPILNATTDNISTQSATTSAPNIIPTEGNKETVLQGSTESSNLLSSTIIVDTATSTAIGDPKAVSTATPSGRAIEEPKITAPGLKLGTSTPSNPNRAEVSSTNTVGTVDSSMPAATISDQTEKPTGNPAQSSTDGTPLPGTTTSVNVSTQKTTSDQIIITTETIQEATPQSSTEGSNVFIGTSTARISLEAISTATPSGRGIEGPKITRPDLKPETSTPSNLNPSHVSSTVVGILDSSTSVTATSRQSEIPGSSRAQSTADSSTVPAPTPSVNAKTESVPIDLTTTSAVNDITTETMKEATPQGSSDNSNAFSSTIAVDTSTAKPNADAISTAMPSGRGIEQLKVTTPGLNPETSTPKSSNPIEVSSTAGRADNSTPTEIPGSSRAQSTADSSTVPAPTPSVNAKTEGVPIDLTMENIPIASTTTSAPNIITTKENQETVPQGSTENPNSLSSTITIGTSTTGSSLEAVSTATPSGRAIEEPKISTPDRSRSAVDSTTTGAIRDETTEDSNLLSSTMTVASSTAETNSIDTPHGGSTEKSKITTPDLNSGTIFPILNPSKVSSTAAGAVDGSTPSGNSAHSTTDGSIVSSAIPILKETTENIHIELTTTSAPNIMTTEGSQETAPQGTTENSNSLSSTINIGTSTAGSSLEVVSTATPSGRAIEESKITTPDLKPETSTPSDPKLSELSSTTTRTVERSTSIAGSNDQTGMPGSPRVKSTSDRPTVPSATQPVSRSTENVPFKSTTTSAVNDITTKTIKETTPQGSSKNSSTFSSTIAVDTSTARHDAEAISTATPSGRAIEEPKITSPGLNPETFTPKSLNPSEVSSTARGAVENGTPVVTTSDQTEKPTGKPEQSTTTSSANVITTEAIKEMTPHGRGVGTDIRSGKSSSSAAEQAQFQELSSTPNSHLEENITNANSNGSGNVVCNNSYISNDGWKKLINDDHEKLTVISIDPGDKSIQQVSKNGNMTKGQLVNIMYISGGKTVDGGKGIILGGDCNCTSNSADGRKVIYIARESDITDEQKDTKSQSNGGSQDGSQNIDDTDKQTNLDQGTQVENDKTDGTQTGQGQNTEGGKSKQRLIILNYSNFESSKVKESIFSRTKSKETKSWSNSNGVVFAKSKDGPTEAIAVANTGNNPEATAINFPHHSETKGNDDEGQDSEASKYSADIKNMENLFNNHVQNEVSKQMSQISSMFPAGRIDQQQQQQSNMPFMVPQHNFNNNMMQFHQFPFNSFPSNFPSPFGNNGQGANGNGYAWNTNNGKSSSSSSSTFYKSKESSSKKGSSGSAIYSESSRKKRDIQSTYDYRSTKPHPPNKGFTGVGNNDIRDETWKAGEGSILKFLMKYNPFRANQEVSFKTHNEPDVSTRDSEPITKNKRRFPSILEILKPSYHSKLSINEMTEMEK